MHAGAEVKRAPGIDLSHHLSDLSKARQTSPLKGLQKYLGHPNLINLAGGLPHPDYFPYSRVSADALVPSSFATSRESSLSWLWNLFSGDKSTSLTVPRYPAKDGDINLAQALQYGLARGMPQIQDFIRRFTAEVYQPAYDNWATLINSGNTDGWCRAALTLCNPGEGIFAAEWTYPSAKATVIPLGVRMVPLPMDIQGIRSDKFREILATWDDKSRNMSRPHVLYTIPIGQNPTGGTMSAPRKQEIYNICVEFDIIIVEDDPYYFLQHGQYLPKASRGKSKEIQNDKWYSTLEPSYLAFDVQGRVIRLDSFSKVIAPGCRLGWFTCNPLFAERLERQGETSLQAPCGFSQALVTSLLLNWKDEGYTRWLRGLQAQYISRRDFFVDCLLDTFHFTPVTVADEKSLWDGGVIYQAFREKSGNRSPVLSFVPPTSGMFVWLKVHFETHPLYEFHGQEALETKLWLKLAESGVLFGPGVMFSASEPEDTTAINDGHMRVSFSNEEFDKMKTAVEIFKSTLDHFYDEKR
ncbi:PLP-dependent transferase [Pluteus cervinus]|uniref:PLP-dependent transferase n=1 Tax=Pluteus cervinus TaxID=181527 RepID=A0ACD3BE71_9AGAR|nr:PLP-dependent transferase [Pluteus cervinus]